MPQLHTQFRPCPHVSGYFRICNFLFPDTATVHTYSANATATPEKNKPLSKVEKNISSTNPITYWWVNPDIFLSDDVKSLSSLSPNNKPIWRHNVEGEQSKFPATISLYSACSEDILVQRSLAHQSESGYHRIRVDGRIRFKYATCGRRNFLIRNEKVADSKISGYVLTVL